MTISRRQFLLTVGSSALAVSLPLRRSAGKGAPIKVGSLMDNSGNLDIIGKPLVMATELAVEDLNSTGGVLGREIELKQYDTQSDIALYTNFAQRLVHEDKVDFIHGGLTSASREAIRQVFRRATIPYFYNCVYEGGVCDRNFVNTGTTPAQVVEPLVDRAIKQWGNKLYVLAADYNYGQIIAKWIAYYTEQRNGTVLQAGFFPLDVTDFGSTIAKIQEAGPSFVMSALVGGAHMSFYRQWAASGMNEKIPLASTVFGLGNEHKTLSAAEGDGILVCASYSEEIETPANKDFLAKWKSRYGNTDLIAEQAVMTYQGIKLWAEIIEKAGSTEYAAIMKEIESAPQIEGPCGKLTLDAKTHHAIVDVRVMVVKDQKLMVVETWEQRPPTDTLQFCDLQANPDDNKQYEVTG